MFLCTGFPFIWRSILAGLRCSERQFCCCPCAGEPFGAGLFARPGGFAATKRGRPGYIKREGLEKFKGI